MIERGMMFMISMTEKPIKMKCSHKLNFQAMIKLLERRRENTSSG
jgi:hypothetical protein